MLTRIVTRVVQSRLSTGEAAAKLEQIGVAKITPVLGAATLSSRVPPSTPLEAPG